MSKNKDNINGGLNRSLSSGQMEMIALGGTIGVGLFMGSTSTIKWTGPSVLLAYAVVGVLLYAVMRALGEMIYITPGTGSFADYATNYIHPLAGYLSRSHAVQRPKSPSQWEIRTLTTPSHATNIQPVEDLHRCGEFIVKAGRKRPISPCDVIVAHVITACERYSLRNAKPAINGGGSMPMPLGVGGRHPVEAHPVGRPAG